MSRGQVDADRLGAWCAPGAGDGARLRVVQNPKLQALLAEEEEPSLRPVRAVLAVRSVGRRVGVAPGRSVDDV